MSFLDDLLGGSQSTTNPSTVFEPQAQFLGGQYFPELSRLFQTMDPSSLTPGFTGTEEMGREGALQTAGQIGTSLIDPAKQALMQLFGAGDPGGELVQNAITGATAPLFEQFENIIAPEIRRQSGAMGQPGGSGGVKATRMAASDLFNQAGNIGSQIALQANQQGLNAIQGGLSAVPGLTSASLLPSDIQRQIGAEGRQMDIAQAGSDLSFLEQIKQLVGQPTVTGGGGTSSSTPGLASLFSFQL